MFVSMIAPTALDWTIDLATICAFYRTAWTPFMRDTMDKIAEQIKAEHPDIAYMFDEKVRNIEPWSPKFAPCHMGTKTRPEFKLLDYNYDDKKFRDTKQQSELEKKDFEISTASYDAGVISKLDLIQLKENVLSTDKLVADQKINCLVDYIGLYKAVGSQL